MTIRKFAGILTDQLLSLAASLAKDFTTNIPLAVVTQPLRAQQDFSSPSTNTNSFKTRVSDDSCAHSYTDCNGVVHCPMLFSPSKGSRCGIKPRRCS